MRVSEFWHAVNEEFGESHGRVVTRDLVLADAGDRTAVEAIDSGVDTREIWIALCKATDVPASRWYGVGQLRKK